MKNTKQRAAELLKNGIHYRAGNMAPFFGVYFTIDKNGIEHALDYNALSLVNDIDHNFPLTIHDAKTGNTKLIGALTEKLIKHFKLKTN